MGRHRLPTMANRIRLSRGFESAWYSDVHYADLLQRDWQLAKQAWSLITRASRSEPKQNLTLSQQLQHIQAVREAREAGKTGLEAKAAADAVVAASQVQAKGMAGCDYPNHRVSRIFTQQLPYKSIVNTFAYANPPSGPQNKYGLFPKTNLSKGSSARSRDQGGGGRGGVSRPSS